MTVLNACTIVSKNYVAFARVLARSFLDHHPGGRFFVLLVDRNDGHIDPAQEPFELLEVEELDNVPERDAFLFKYTLLECNTAVKPYLLEHLLARYELERLVYLDPDIWVLRPLAAVAEALDRHAIALTPHLTAPLDDAAHPGELAILQAGAYNLGFLGLRSAPLVRRFLRWWQERLYDRCVVRVEDALFVDQKWIDLVPGLFPDVAVLTDRGLNVAYWNLHDRPVTLTGDDVSSARAAGEPLVFFHFSGIDPEHLEGVSKHQDRYRLSDLGDAAFLYRRYAERLLAAGHRQAKPWPYAFGRFDNGVAIPDLARRLFLDLGPERRRRFGNPFESAGDDSFFAWLNAPHRPGQRPPYLSRLLYHLYAGREDLRRIFPRVEDRDLAAFCSWLEGFGRYEWGLDDAFLRHVHRDSRATLFTVAGLRRRLANRARRLYHSAPGRTARSQLKRLLGHHRYGELRRRLRPETPAPAPAPGRFRLPLPPAIERVGINVVGYLQAETGMGEAARATVRALDAAGVPLSLHSLDLGVVARRQDTTFAETTSDFPYDVNLLVVNADQVPAVYDHLGGEVFGRRANVGLWLWELAHFPDRFLPAFDLLHEVWTPSTFCVDAISSISPIPVRRLPLAVEVRAGGDGGIEGGAPEGAPTPARDAFGLPAGAFVFLFSFSYLSYAERKNPLALIAAFERAFPAAAGERVALVLKTSQSDFAPEAHRRLVAAAQRDRRIVLIDRYLSRAETDVLTDLADCYVSLHRSEGFGLTLAEAMARAKPVVATPYGGVTDFFHAGTGFPVAYELVALAQDVGPYPAGACWADPDVGDAARQLRSVYERRDEARDVGRRGRDAIGRQLSHDAVGAIGRRHLERLVERINRQQVGRLL